jgi:cysteine desulfurase/selenocysteine lyase
VVSGLFGADPEGTRPPFDLDVAKLAQMANAMFTEGWFDAPGMNDAGGTEAQLPSVPFGGADPAAATRYGTVPSLPTDLPGSSESPVPMSSAPIPASRFGPDQSLPHGNLAAPVSANPLNGAPAPASPYYFISEASSFGTGLDQAPNGSEVASPPTAPSLPAVGTHPELAGESAPVPGLSGWPGRSDPTAATRYGTVPSLPTDVPGSTESPVPMSTTPVPATRYRSTTSRPTGLPGSNGTAPLVSGVSIPASPYAPIASDMTGPAPVENSEAQVLSWPTDLPASTQSLAPLDGLALPSTPYYFLDPEMSETVSPPTAPWAAPGGEHLGLVGDMAEPVLPAWPSRADPAATTHYGTLPSLPNDLPGSTESLAPLNGLPVPSTPYYFLGEASSYRTIVDGASDTLETLPQPLAPWSPEVGEHRGLADDAEFYFINQRPPGPMPVEQNGFDVEMVRRDFPILSEQVNGHQLVWLDNAATTQKPQAVIDRLVWYYTHENSNIHRAAHELAARSTDAFESARAKVARFLGAPSADNIVFVRGATEGINLVAQSWGRHNVSEGDEIVISHLEHHANIIPWQQLAQEKGAKLRVIPVDDDGQIILSAYRQLLNDRTRLVAIAHVSNALGTIVPVREVIEMAHAVGACVLVDGAQAVAHTRLNMETLDPDFYVFSGHKVFAPTGIGAVYGKTEVLKNMPPWQGGGNMIRHVTFESSTFQDPPGRFEAGTGNIADAIGLGSALDYLEKVGLEAIERYEHDLLGYATGQMLTIPGLHLIGTAPAKASVLSFVLAGYKPEEIGTALNREGIAVRAGHHCAQPILRRFGYESTVRASLAMYNTCAEVDQFVSALRLLATDRPTG